MYSRVNRAAKILVLTLSVVSFVVSAGCKPPQTDYLTDNVLKSDLIVFGTITDEKYDILPVDSVNATYSHIYTIFTLTVEKVIKGNPDTKEVLIKVFGNPDNPGPEPVTHYFHITDKTLVLLHLDDDGKYSIIYPGIAWLEAGHYTPTESLESVIGRIIKIMVDNKIPVALPPSEWPKE